MTTAWWKGMGGADGLHGARAARLLGYFLVSFGTLGMQYAFGPIYAELLTQLQGSREVTSRVHTHSACAARSHAHTHTSHSTRTQVTALVGSLSIGLMDGGGIIAGAIVLRYGSRRCCLVAAVVTTLGWGLSALVAEPWQLLLTYSVLVGVGHSLALHSAIVCIGRWFSRKLALAHALPNTGGALSPLLMGMLAPRLFDATGWRGAFLVLGGINGAALLAAGCLLTPPPAEGGRGSRSKGRTSELKLPTAPVVPETKAEAAVAAVEVAVEVEAAEVEAAEVEVKVEPAEAVEASHEAGLREVAAGGRMQLLCVSMLCFGLGAWMMVGNPGPDPDPDRDPNPNPKPSPSSKPNPGPNASPSPVALALTLTLTRWSTS